MFVGIWIIQLAFRSEHKAPQTLRHTVHDRFKGVRGIGHNKFVARLWVPSRGYELHLGTFTSKEGAAEVIDQGRIYMVSFK